MQSAISWGGEENDPPLYGNIVISIIPNQGSNISTSTKQEIINFFKDYNVGSITPVIVDVEKLGLDTSLYSTHSMRRTKPYLIYKKTKNLRVVQLLLGHKKLESTVRYLGIEVDDALEISESIEV
mgnify:CR=1 FL=1